MVLVSLVISASRGQWRQRNFPAGPEMSIRSLCLWSTGVMLHTGSVAQALSPLPWRQPLGPLTSLHAVICNRLAGCQTWGTSLRSHVCPGLGLLLFHRPLEFTPDYEHPLWDPTCFWGSLWSIFAQILPEACPFCFCPPLIYIALWVNTSSWKAFPLFLSSFHFQNGMPLPWGRGRYPAASSLCFSFSLPALFLHLPLACFSEDVECQIWLICCSPINWFNPIKLSEVISVMWQLC